MASKGIPSKRSQDIPDPADVSPVERALGRRTFLAGAAVLLSGLVTEEPRAALPESPVSPASPAMKGPAAAHVSPTPRFAYVGSLTSKERNGHGKGIGVYRIDPATYDWQLSQLIETMNPGYLAFARQKRFLYSSHADGDFVSAFAVDGASGRLTALNTQSTGAMNGAYVAVDPTERFVLVANFTSGHVTVLPIGDDGSLGAYSDLVAMPGKTGPLKGQGGAQPHQIRFDPSGRFVLVPDRGLDMVHVYGFDGKTGKLVPHEPGAVASRPAAGPRHIDWHPSKPYAYGTNEFDSTVTFYHWDAEKGGLTPRHFVSATPDDFFGGNTPSGIWVAPSGRFVYISNRGHDSIGIFSVSPKDGTLSPLAWEPTQGKTPRYFGLSAAGDRLYVANQEGDTTVTFRVDQASGRITPIGRIIATESPMCVLFL